jgi:HAD domain in Swiss Army Knife RNA repair proteins
VTKATRPPILFLDVDGVISLFGFAPDAGPLPGPLHWIDGMAHCIPENLGERLVRLAEGFELVWATGWEERANEHLPFILKLPFRDLPCLTFDGQAVFGTAHWKVDAVDAYAGDRPAAWVDDNLDEECQAWAERRTAPTLLVETEPEEGLTDEQVERLLAWAASLPSPA